MITKRSRQPVKTNAWGAQACAIQAQLEDGRAVNFGRRSGRLLAESAAVVLAQLDPQLHPVNIDADFGDIS